MIILVRRIGCPGLDGQEGKCQLQLTSPDEELCRKGFCPIAG